MLRHLLAAPARHHRITPAPQIRVGDADRDAAAAALGEHFAHGRLTLDELDTRLGAVLAATTHGELSRATGDLPELMVVSAQVSFYRARRRRAWHPPRPVSGRRAPSGEPSAQAWRAIDRLGSVYRSVLSQSDPPIKDATMRKIVTGPAIPFGDVAQSSAGWRFWRRSGRAERVSRA